MAAKLFSRSVLPKHTSISSLFSTSSPSLTPSTTSRLFSSSSLSTSTLFRLRTLSTVAVSSLRHLPPSTGVRGFATRQTNSSLNDPNPNWSNRPPKETILLDGCDFEHWLVVMEKPDGDPTRDEIIESYIKTLALVVGSEQEARMKIYSVSTQCYFAFGALVPEELSYKIKELPRVRWVLPDSYLNVREKDYGGEPFINGEAVPYDPKYHEEWKRNNQRANERNRRNDRPRNQDRSRNFNRRENMQNRDFNNGPPMPPNQNMHNPPPNVRGPVSPSPNSMAPPLNNTGALGGPPNMRSSPPSNFSGPSGQGGYQNNIGGGQGGYSGQGGYGQNNTGGGQGGYAQNNTGGYAQNNTGGYAQNNTGSGQGGYAQNNTGGGQGGYAQNTGGGQGGYAQNNMGGQGGYAQNNMGGQGGYSSNNNVGGPGRYSANTGGSSDGVQQNLMPPNNIGRIPDRDGVNFQNSRDVPNNGGGLPYQNSRDRDVPEFNQNAGIPGGNAFQA